VTIDALRARLETVLRGVPGLDLAILFGSTARGVATEASDIDLAIEGAPQSHHEVAGAVARSLDREVDVADLRNAGVPLLRELLSDGVVVFERRPGLAGSFRARALLAVATDGPWYDRMRDAAVRRIAREGFVGSR
jgi:predicted nucleotidyltransferase